MKLRHKVVWITGASSGLGQALAYSLAKRGAVLVLGARRNSLVQETAKICRGKGAGGSFAAVLDLEQASSVKSFVKKGLKFSGGRADLLINNAGVHLLGKIEEITEANIEKVVNINVKGPIRMIQALLPSLKNSRGMVVQISSSMAWRGMAGAAGYSASKAALDRVSESLRDEVAGDGVKVLNVHPGVLMTDFRKSALVNGPLPVNKLPFPRSAELVAEDIVRAIEKEKKRLFVAPWPLRIFYCYVNWLFPSFVDWRMKDVDARKS